METKPLRSSRYQSIFLRDKFTCQYCGLDMSNDLDTFWHGVLSIDHIKPKKHGGKIDDPSNLVTCCHACNINKRDRRCETIEQGREIIREERTKAERWFKRYVLKEG